MNFKKGGSGVERFQQTKKGKTGGELVSERGNSSLTEQSQLEECSKRKGERESLRKQKKKGIKIRREKKKVQDCG